MRTIRPMQAADFEYGMELCRLAGWNQTPQDWQRLTELTPAGVFVCQEDGQLAGTASTICYSHHVGWIGMILVHPDFRGRGIGTDLMRACIDYLQGRGIETIKLDATDDGRPVYLKLGFTDERPIYRYTADRAAVAKACITAAGEPQSRAISDSDWHAIEALDAPAFGADRVALLKSLRHAGPSAVHVRNDMIVAYGFARPGKLAGYLGPIVSIDADAANFVATDLLRELPGETFFWDILPDNHLAAAMAESMGFSVARKLTRMHLGPQPHGGNVGKIFAIAGFELG